MKTVEVTRLVNATVAISPPPTSGNDYATPVTTDVIVTATKVNQALSSRLALRLTDAAGNVTDCDPIDQTVKGGDGPRATATFRDVPHEEDTITVTNGSPGLNKLRVTVNGKRFQLELADGQVVSLDISSALRPGDANRVTLRSIGRKTASADVLIWDGESTTQAAGTGHRATIRRN